MLQHQKDAIAQLRAEGYCVVVFGPGELNGFDAEHLQGELVQAGNELVGTPDDDEAQQ